MTPTELTILGRNDIRSNKFAAAAISYIYNAFGDIIRSKESWPFSSKKELGWQNSKGTEEDLKSAFQFLLASYNKYLNENSKSNDVIPISNTINDIKTELEDIDKELDLIDSISESIDNITNDTNDKINNVIV